MNRSDAQRLLSLILDHEATEQERRDFQNYLQADPEFAAYAARERKLHDALITRLRAIRPVNAPGSLRGKVTAALDAIDAEERLIPVSRPAPVVKISPVIRWMALAASLVLAVGIGFFSNRLVDHHAVFAPLEAAHFQAVAEFNATGKYLPTTETGKCRESACKMLASLGVKLAGSVDGLTEVGGCIDNCSCGESGHFMFAQGDKVISVFVLPASKFSIPDELTGHQIEKDGITYYDHDCRGCRLVYQRVGDVVVVTATSDRKVELVGLKPVVI